MGRSSILLPIAFVAALHCGGEVESSSSVFLDGGQDARGQGNAEAGVAISADSSARDSGSMCTNNGCRVCSSDADCGGGQRCAFSPALACGWEEERCSAGLCIAPNPPAPCGDLIEVTACGCDGTTVHWVGGCEAVFPEGFGPVPFAHLGACESGAACTTSADCAAGQACAFLAGAGCAAKGQCQPLGECDCDNVCCGSGVARACDGSTTEIDCRGYAPKPVCLSECD